VGLLDDLKRQAQAKLERQQQDQAGLARNAALVEAACRTAFQYWLDLARQLNVLEPVTRVRHALDPRHVFEGLPMRDFRVDARRRGLGAGPEASLHDHIVFSCELRSGRELVLTRDMPHEIERLTGRLVAAGVRYQQEIVRDPDTGRYLHHRYAFTADFTASVRLLPRHGDGRVQFQVANFEGFETLLVDTPAHEVGQQLLDELTRLMLGEPNRFAAMTQVLRRA
jgi:hypothetical protein